MSNYVMMTSTDYQSICDKLREKTGKTDLIKSGDVAEELETLSNFIDTTATVLADDIINKSVTSIVDDKISALRDYALCNCENLTHARFLSATSLGTQAFTGCTSLVVADFPKVETIDYACLGGCTSLTSLYFPSLKYCIGIWPFYGCTNLQKVDCPVLEAVSGYMFNDCKSLKTVNLPMATIIGVDAFYYSDYDDYDSLLTDVNAPLVNDIKSRAFYNCSSLKEANFPLLTSIDKQAFYGCKSLTTINFPNLEYLGKPADGVGAVPDSIEIFKNCSNLKTVILPLVKEIYDSSFYRCTELTEVYIPSVEFIDTNAFYGCEKLSSLDCPKLKTLVGSALYNCTGLSYINLPLLETLSGDIGGDNFDYGMNKITELNFPMLKEFGGIRYMNNLVKVTLPSVTNIPYLGFYNCPSLKVADFTDLTSIGSSYDERAFVGCTSLDTIILRGSTVCEIGATSFNGFNGTDDSAPFAPGGTGGTIYVPEALIESYKTADGWSTFYNAGTCNFIAIEGSKYEIVE